MCRRWSSSRTSRRRRPAPELLWAKIEKAVKARCLVLVRVGDAHAWSRSTGTSSAPPTRRVQMMLISIDRQGTICTAAVSAAGESPRAMAVCALSKACFPECRGARSSWRRSIARCCPCSGALAARHRVPMACKFLHPHPANFENQSSRGVSAHSCMFHTHLLSSIAGELTQPCLRD